MNKYQKSLKNIKCMPITEDEVLGDLHIYETIDDNLNPQKFNVQKSLSNLQELVDRNTAQKPYLEGDGYYDGKMVYDIWICPNCGKEYEIDYDGKHKYCPDCGQLIEWNEELLSSNNSIQKLINKENKFRWHDLRKDPTDLPKNNSIVVFATSINNKKGYSLVKFDKNYILTNAEIAWKYEEFEDE